tara:strand:- start:31075 stop:31815 length:741 start_codon:yes stop_codon:yes gene_type:complete
MSEKKFDKLVFFLPNTFTALNMGCGFVAIMYSMQGMFYKACMFLVLGAIFDSVDGRVARLTGTQSSFGEQFDSLSDLISFGIAPALIFYNKFLPNTGRIGIVIAFLFLLCGALRLARFNANINTVSSDYFQGLPIPGAALAILSYILISLEFGEYFNNVYVAAPYLAFYALLMISNIPFPSFKKSDSVRKHRRKILFLIFIVISLLFIYEELMIGVIITLYVLSSLVTAVINRNKFKGIINWDESE